MGQRVSLGVEPQLGIKVMEVLNDFDQTSTRRYKLPNLTVGTPINMVVRLQIPPLSQSNELLKVRFAWDDSDKRSRQVLHAGLELPLVSPEQFSDFPANETVQEQVALLMAARARREAIEFTDRGDYAAAAASLQNVRLAMACMAPSEALLDEQRTLEQLETDFQNGNVISARKKARSQSYNLTRSGKSMLRQSLDS